MTHEEIVRRAEAAQRLLGNEVLLDAIQQMEDQAFTAFRAAQTDDERRTAQAQAKIASEFLHQLQVIVSDGEFVQANKRKNPLA